MHHKKHLYDAIVIGGGPAGSTFGTMMARMNRSVLVLERDHFPRFHIGESLLPYMARLLDQLGLLEQAKQQGFVKKRGAEFTDVEGNFRRVDFAAQGKGWVPDTFQVERAHFDQFLLEHAMDSGAEVLQEAKVKQLLFKGEQVIGVEYEKNGETRRVYARYVVDASGRFGVIARQFKLRKVNERLKMVAVFRHFDQFDEANNPGVEGDIQIGSHKDGWVWAIPIRDDAISIGTVTHITNLKQSTPKDIFETYHQRIPRIVQRIQGARPITDYQVESDFCYHADQIVGPGWLMIGDSGCFVDPIYSGGVYLAMVTGIKAAETVDQVLNEEKAEAEAMKWYSDFYKTGYDCYFRLIYAFYESGFSFKKYLESIPVEFDEAWSHRLLCGDFWSRQNPLTQYLRSQDKWRTFEPFEVQYGCPVYPEEQYEREVAIS
jgi:FADH2-dependent halogenase